MKIRGADPDESVSVDQVSSVVHGHTEPLEPIRGQKTFSGTST